MTSGIKMLKKSTLFLLFMSLCVLVAYPQRGKRKNRTLRDMTGDAALKAESTLIEAEKQLILENYDKAYELFLVAEELNPQNAAVNFKLAEVLVKKGDLQNAAEYAKKARVQDPDNKFYYIQNAEIAQGLGNIEEASRIYEEMIGRIPKAKQYLFDLALLYQFQNRYDEALKTYERAEKHFGLSESVLLEKQKIYLKQGDLPSLISAWDQLISKNPQEYRYFFQLTEILINNDLLDEAKKRLLQFKENEGENAQIDLYLANVEKKQGNYVEALKLLDFPIQSDEVALSEKLKLLTSFLTMMKEPGVSPVLVELTKTLTKKHDDSYQALAFSGDVLYQLGEKQQAVDNYLKAIALSPGNFSIWQNTINLEFQLQQFDSVVVHAEKALEYFPNQAIFYFFSGVGHYVKNDYEFAVQALETGKKYTSDNSLLSEFHGQLGDAYNGLEKYQESYAAYDKALSYNSNNDHVLNNYSYYLSLRNEKMDQALAMCEKLIAKHPNNPTYLDTYGWVLYVTGDFKGAEKFLKKAIDQDTEDGTILEHYGDVLFRLGEEEEAVKYWEMASQTSEASENIERKIRERKIYE